MSQVTHPRISLPTMARPRRVTWIAALLTLAAAVAVVLVLALGGDSTEPGTSSSSRSGPNESGIAAAVGSRAPTGPNEAGIAASVGTSSAAIESQSSTSSGPSESSTAASISGR